MLLSHVNGPKLVFVGAQSSSKYLLLLWTFDCCAVFPNNLFKSLIEVPKLWFPNVSKQLTALAHFTSKFSSVRLSHKDNKATDSSYRTQPM